MFMMITNCFQVNRNAVLVVELNLNLFCQVGKKRDPNNQPRKHGLFDPYSLEIKSANNSDNSERNRVL